METTIECKESIGCDTNETNGETSKTSTDGQVMSKKQMKRALRHKKWLETRPEKRRLEKEKKKAKVRALRQQGVDVVSRSSLKKQYVPMSSSKCKVTVCIDCDFSDYMDDRDMKKLVKQIGRCYSVNRHSSSPVQLYITSIANKMRDIFTKCQPGFTNWDAVCVDTHWTQTFADKTKIIYLTSDSDATVPEPKDICAANDYVFIIGGLVDHNRHKGLCHRLAVEQTVGHSRLPIDEYIQMTQRRVLAVNHVFEIMLMASNGSCDDWTNIFQTVIPLRKLQQTSGCEPK